MATTKVTITLDDDQLEAVRELVAAGRSPSISGFLKHAVQVALNDAAGWQVMLREALEQTGGPLTTEEVTWADHVLGQEKRSGRAQRRRSA